MAAGDTFRAAASDQLEIWAERTGCEIVVAERENAKASSGREVKCLMMSFRFLLVKFQSLCMVTDMWS